MESRLPKVIFEDDDILVVDKPVGLVVNSSDTTTSETLQDIVRAEGPDYIEDDSEFQSRSGIVHRLDKDTSGVIVIAKNEAAFLKIQAQFKERTVEKEYMALVLGKVEDSLIEVDAPIGRNPRNRLKFAVVDGGKEAFTKFTKVKELTVLDEVLTLLTAFPKTGRTHQIRVHLAALGYPVAGDILYSTRSQYEKWNPHFNRLMLHSCKISFTHPTTGDRVCYEAPLPPEFML